MQMITDEQLNKFIREAFLLGKKAALKGGIRANVTLNKKDQVIHVTNHGSNATIIMDKK